MLRKIAILTAGIVLCLNVFVLGQSMGIESGYTAKMRELHPDGMFGDPFASAYSVIGVHHFSAMILLVLLLIALLMKESWHSYLIAAISILISLLVCLNAYWTKNMFIDLWSANGSGWDPQPIQAMLKYDLLNAAILLLLLIYQIFLIIRRALSKTTLENIAASKPG